MRRVMLAAVLGVAALPAGAADLSGIWMHVGDRLGLVIGHVEELRVAPGGAAELRVHRLEPRWRDACGSVQPPADCAEAVVAVRGRLAVDAGAGTLRIEDAEVVTPPFVHPYDAEGWALIGTANGTDWTFALDGDTLDLLGALVFEDELYELPKRFHRVPEGFAADWMTVVADLLEIPLAQSGCALDVLLAERGAAARVAVELGAAARVRRGLTEATREMRRPGADPRAVIEGILAPFAAQVADPAAPVVAAPGFDAADWAATVALMRWVAAGEGRADLVLPAAEPQAEAVRACLGAFG
jgi:hypothetical protein